MSAPNIGHLEVERLMDRGAQILDALPPEDYAKQHLPGAINVPLEDFSEATIAKLDKTRAVVTYCFDNQCDLSARLAARLILEGFREVYEYGPSLADWGAYGHPLEGEEGEVVRTAHIADRDAPTCSPDESLDAVASRMGGSTACAVLDDDGVVIGRIRQDDLASRGKVARDVMFSRPSTFRPDVFIIEMADWFKKRPKATEFIITTPDGRFFGTLYRSAVEHVVEHAAAGSRSR
jgi:rhodanese-related sulfurtransferase